MNKPDKTFSLYKGKIIIDFWEEKHLYIRRDTGRVPISATGATGIVSDANILMAWAIKLAKNHLIGIIEDGGMVLREDIDNAGKLYRQARDTAGDIGTAVHSLIEQYVKASIAKSKSKIKVPDNEKVLNGFIAFKNWVAENKVEFEASEKIVYSKNYDYVGTLDCRARINGKLTLVDFKTGNYLSKTTPWQVSAYLHADQEESGRKYEDRMILHIKKDTGEFKAVHLGMEEHELDLLAFIGVLQAKRRLK